MSQFAQYVEVWQRDERDTEVWHYRHYGPHEVVELVSINVRIAMEEIYRRLNFVETSEEEE